MNQTTIETNDRTALRLFASAFPETNFRSITVSVFHGPKSLNSYWSDGYRDYFRIVAVDGSGTLAAIPQNGTQFDDRNLSLSELPAGFALAVKHMQGSRQRGTLYVHESNLTPMLPAPGPVAPWIETAVLAVVCSLKSFARRDQAARMGIGAAEYDATIATLKAKRLLTAVGGASPDGRNADNYNRRAIGGGAIQWHWQKLAMAGDRDCEEKRTADRLAEYARSVAIAE